MVLKSETILDVNNLSKRFDKRTIIEDASFKIRKNTIVGLIGKNGAGKTTLMRMLIGFLKSDSGSIMLNGEKLQYGKSSVRIGYLTDVPVFYDFMNAYEYLSMCIGLKKEGVGKSDTDYEVEELLKLVNLKDNKNKRIKSYSRGMKQRLGIAQCLIGEPSLIICDEPMSALDPDGRKEVEKIFNSIKKETSILLSTHILTDIDRLCDEIIFLDKGIAKIINLKDNTNFSAKSRKIEIDFIGQEFSFIEKFELFLKNNDIGYKIEKKKFIISNSKEEIIKKIYYYFGSNDMNVHPSNFRISDMSVDDII